ncbi:c-type cytochrome [Pseudomonas sp. SST3]|uniref:c-type cytochrome n=1 Tax=Pseudomonas sp. SST3 TaxID=2267882 RepID=UPI000DFFF9F1|nr:cytochrome c [Pseudomonas sp. SST3]NKQ09734.1 cytochrome c [Pseudomonas sp. SST3]
MLKTLVTLLLAVLAIVLIGTAVVYSGVINVAADDPHSSPVHALLEVARERSIAVRAEGIEVPDLNDPELIRSGAGNYDAMCVACHLAPGVAGTELNQNLNPAPPDLTNRDRPDDPASDFWVIKHGIKATGMPAWGKSVADPYIWGLVALLEQLPSLTAMDYRALVATSDGHQHGGGEMAPLDHNDEHPDTDDRPAGKDQADTHQKAEPATNPEGHHRADGSEHMH